MDSSDSKNTDTDEWAQWIEDGIAKGYINYHDYDEFQNINRIDTGGASKDYRAIWESSDTLVILKSLNNKDFIKETVNEVLYINNYL